MAASFTHARLPEVEDSAGELGIAAFQETRFAHAALESPRIGVTHHRIRPGTRQGFAHRHEQAEEVYVVLAGSGRVKLEDQILELRPLDALRVDPPVLRCFEAGPDGMEVLAFGPRHPADGAVVNDWWRE